MDEEQVRKIVEALGGMSDALTEAEEKIKENQKEQDKLIRSIAKNNTETDKNALLKAKENAALLQGEKLYVQQMQALGLTKNALGEFERATVKLTTEQKKRLAEEQAISNKTKAREEMGAKIQTMMADKTGTLIKGLSAFGEGLNKTIFDSTKGQGKYGEVLDDAGGKIQALGLLFGPWGKAITFATGALLKLAGAAFKQQEQLNKTYETLSEFGAVDVSGIEGMFKNLQNIGFTIKELDKFSGILKAAGPNLATLGVTAAEGAKKFAETMAAVKNSGAEKELRMLGFTSETMAKTFADYQGMMGRMGFIQNKSTQEVARQSVEYAKTLDELSKLTGQSRDELQKRMDADANDMKFRLKLQEVDEKTRERLQKASALIGEFGEDTASGFREMVANNGQVVGEASAKLMLSTGNAAKQIVEDLNAGKISHIEAARLIAEAKAKQVERFRAVGKLDADIMKELGLSVKDMDAINKYRGKTQEEVERMEKERQLQMQGQLDSQRAAEIQRQITERNMEQAKDRLINALGKTLVPALEMLHKVVNAVGKGLAEFTKFITFGKVDFTDLFKSTDDIAGEIKETSNQLDKTNKQIQRINDAKATAAAKEELYLRKHKEVQDLEEQLSKETNEERKKALIEELDQKRKERATLQADASQAARDAKKGGNALQRLQEEKERLEKQKVDQEKKLAQAGGAMGVAKESPEIEKIRNEQQGLLNERNKLEEQINDKTKLIYQQTLDSLNFKEEDLKDEKKRTEFEKKYSEAKKAYVDRRIEIDRRIEKSEQDIARIKKEEVDKTVKRTTTTGTGAVPPSAIPPISQEAKGNLQGVATAMRKRGITDEAYIKAALGNVMKESGGQLKGENLDYSKTSNERIREVFGDRAKNLSDQQLTELKQDKQKFTEAMYGGEWGKKQLGNTEAGDAWKFRGRGYIQLTGRSNYAKASKEIFGDERLIENPDLVNDPNVAAELTAWYFGKNKESMQASMGFGRGPLTQEQANLLATSQVAGGDVRRKSQYVQTELLGKVAGYAGQIDTSTIGPTASASGSQIPKVATGGLLSGPDSGYPVLLHGRELVIPMPNTGDLASVLESVKKTALSDDISQKTNSSSSVVNSQAGMDQFIALQTDLMNLIANKLDMLDSRLAKSNDIQENILTYSAT